MPDVPDSKATVDQQGGPFQGGADSSRPVTESHSPATYSPIGQTYPRQSDANLIKLWVAQFISRAGDQLFITAGVFLVLRLSTDSSGSLVEGATFRAGMMEAARAFPALVLGLLAGALADRFDRRMLMFASDLARAGLLAALVAVYLSGGLEWWMLPIGAFLLSTFSCVFEPARDSLLPQLVPKDRLFRANSLIQTSMPLAIVIGSLVVASAGFGDKSSAQSAPIGGLVALLGIDAASFALSAMLILAIRRRDIAPLAVTHRTSRPSIVSLIGEVAELAITDRRLGALLVLTAANNFFLMGPATVGAVILFERDLGRGLMEFGIFEACMAAGLLCGLLWVMKYGRHWRRGRLLLFGLVLDGVTYVPFLFLGRETPNIVFYALILFHGFFIPWIVIPRTSLIQELWPGTIQGRIFAFVALTVTGFHALSALATGKLAEVMSAHVLYAIGGGGAAIVGLIGFLSPTLRNLDSRPRKGG